MTRRNLCLPLCVCLLVCLALHQFHQDTPTFGIPHRVGRPRSKAAHVARRLAACTRRVSSGSPVLVPGSEGPQWWDSRNSASPVVLPPGKDTPEWMMWYYGRAGTKWSKDVDAFLPTGRIGAATSVDGVRWRRLQGPLEGGACLDPADDETAFDCVHVGVGDVVQLPNGTLWMYYFGGGLDDGANQGIRMQIGLAASDDGGRTWERLCGGKPILQPSEAGFDALFVAWPRVLPPWLTAKVPGIPEGKWYMSYHTASLQGGISWAAGAAFSDDGVRWQKVDGPVLRGTAEKMWDSKGVGVRHVVVKQDWQLAMVYEAVDDEGDHAIGLAEGSDGVAWQRVTAPGAAGEGGPYLTKGAEGSWDSRVVGTPYAVPPQNDDDPWRLYYVGEAVGKPGLSIGLAECFATDLTCWRKAGGDAPERLPPSSNEGLFGRVFKSAEQSKTSSAPEPFDGGALDLTD